MFSKKQMWLFDRSLTILEGSVTKIQKHTLKIDMI